MAYITVSNSLRILKDCDFDMGENFMGEIYKKPIYLFNYYEKNRLLGLQELLKNPEEFIKEFYVKIENIDKLKYIYEGIMPAYHSNPACKRLNSNFINFEIPEEIRVKGKEEVKIFREWFMKNKYLLEKSDIFVDKLELAFGIKICPKSIDFKNSGVEIKENLNLIELEQRIDKIISEAGKYFNMADERKKGVIRKFQKHTYLAYSKKKIHNNDTGYSDLTIKKFLKEYDNHFKKPLKELLIEYYRVLYNPELKFEGELLEQLGFKSCGCC